MNPGHFSDLELTLLLEAIYQKYKYDFREYSHASLQRRTSAALVRMKIPSIGALQSQVINNSSLFLELIQYLTVPVTEMFRDPAYFSTFREEVIPHLRTYPSFKVWIAGCSTGEEPYSFAIILHEEGLLDRALIYATDINSVSLHKAKEGFYSDQLVPKFTGNYQKAGGCKAFSDYYDAAYGSISIRPFLKEKILFTDHSLATDTVFSEMHMISCRNVLIYFQKNLQDRALQLFSDSLVSGGFLGIGEKESLRFSAVAPQFEQMMPTNRIYRKKVLPRSALSRRMGSA